MEELGDLDIQSPEIRSVFNLMDSTINKEIAGKTVWERLEDTDDIERIIKTETHRVYNTALYKTASVLGYTHKTWETMLDDKVRDTHDYLEGVTLPIDAEFYTFNGNHAYFPGQFGIAEEDVNCRCVCTYSKEG